MIDAHAFDGIDIDRAGEICHSLLLQHPRRITFAGRAGSGKTSVCEAISRDLIPIINHADTLKEEVLELLVSAAAAGLLHERDEGRRFIHFAHYVGLTPEILRDDCWTIFGRAFADFTRMLDFAATAAIDRDLAFFHGLKAGEYLPQKVKFVERHKGFIRPTLISYGQAIKEVNANPSHWVEQTVTRAIHHSACLNGDTRFAEDELDLLEYCGWTSVYLWIDRETQRVRRPELTDETLNDPTETSIDWTDCAFVIDARQPLPKVLMTIAAWLARPEAVTSFVPPGRSDG